VIPSSPTAKYTCWSCGAKLVDVGRVPLACPRCKAEPNAVVEFPKKLLPKVSWSFSAKAPADAEAMRAALTAYYAELKWEPFDAELLAVVIPSRRIWIRSWHVQNQEPVLLERPHTFTALDLLQATHERLGRYLKSRDHHFFEGFELLKSTPGEPPTYTLLLGS
jgi:hypothetical protein